MKMSCCALLRELCTVFAHCAVRISQRVLADRTRPSSDRVEALKFLIHFVADLHQPLHAIGEARGGNDIHISEFGSSQCGNGLCNLHSAWDVGLIEHTGRTEKDYVSYLEKWISRRNLQREADKPPEAWANESFDLAKKVWLNNGGVVDEAYYREH